MTEPVSALSNDKKIHPHLEGGIVHGNCESYQRKDATIATDRDEEMRQSQKVLCIKVSGFPIVQTDSNSTLCQVPTCKCCSKNCPTSSDEENGSVTKTQEIEEDSQGTPILGKLSFVLSPMPVIPKRGCMNTSGYIKLMTKLLDLRREGNFVVHEQIIREKLAKKWPEEPVDVDMEASLENARAKAFYYQNDVSGAKRILKRVLKLELQLKNPGILIGRALTLLTPVYRDQGKFGKAMRCKEKAQKVLELQDSHEDKAELYQSYGALLNSLPPSNITRKTRKAEAYQSYELACRYSFNNRGREYISVKMAALFLESCSQAANNNTHICGEEVREAKRLLDLAEFCDGTMPLGTKIKHLLLRSDQYCFDQNIAMAIEKAKEAMELIKRHGFELERDSAKKRLSRLYDLQRQEKKELFSSELCSSSEYQPDSEGDSSCLE